MNTLEHGTYLYQAPTLIQQMVKRGVFLVPTLKVGWGIILAKGLNIPDWIMQKNVDSQGDAELSLVSGAKLMRSDEV